MWPPHLRHPSAVMSEQTRCKKLAAGRKLLQQYQQRKCRSGPAESKNKKRVKEGGSPKTNSAGDCTFLKGAAQDHADPAPPPPLGTIRAARVQSVVGPHNTEDMERHCERLVLALDSSRRENQQLYSKIEQLEQERKELQAQQGREKERMAREHEALKAELEQCRLSMQMLASEKAALQCALARTEQVAGESALGPEALSSRLQAAQQRVAELESAFSAASTSQEESKNNIIELTRALTRVQLQLQAKARGYEDLEAENTELQERLQVLLTERAGMNIQIHEGHEALLARAELERQLTRTEEQVSALKVETAALAEELRAERSAGKEKAQQLSEQVRQLREEKEQGRRHVCELESKLLRLSEQRAEPQPPPPAAAPSQTEQQLQAQALQLQEELRSLREQLHAQLQENQSLGLQNLELRQRLWVLEQKAEERAQHAEARLKILEMLEQEQEAKRRVLGRNRELQEELARLQAAAQRLSAEKGELAGLLHSEQREKTSLREKLDALEEKAAEGKERAGLDGHAAAELQELRAKSLAQGQEVLATREQLTASRQQLSSEKEALRQHLLRQSHLLERLQQKQAQHELLAQMEREKFQDTLQCVEATRRENAQLRAQLSALAFPREGEGLGEGEDRGEEAPPPSGAVPEDVDDPQSMWDFYAAALSVAERRKARLGRQLQQQQARCGCLSQLAAQWQSQLEGRASFPTRWLHGLLGRTKQETQAPTRKLRACFPEDLADKVDAQSAVPELQRRCGQLSQHMATIGEMTVFYKEQIDVLEKLCREKDECVSWLSEEKRRKSKELKELLLRLAGADPERQDAALAAAQAPAAQAPAAQAPSRLPGPLKVQVVEEPQGLEAVHLKANSGPVPAEAGVPRPLENPTAEQPAPPLPATPPRQEPGLGQELCLPFFYRTGRNDTFGIISI